MTPRPPCPDPARLRALLDGARSPDSAALIDHLKDCPSCQSRLNEGVAETESTLSRILTHDPRPAGSRAEAMARDGPSYAFLTPSEMPGHLGPYTVIERIGRGGMGVVFKAFDTVLHRTVAIKVLAPELVTSDLARRRFLREARAAAAVWHDNIVAIHAVDQAHGLPYLVMQLIQGMSLRDKIRQTGPLELKEILRIGMQVASGLAAAHARGLVHRDIKPANILLEHGSERVKITDFGLARAADGVSPARSTPEVERSPDLAPDLTQRGHVVGTPQYMAPEQARGEAVDHRSDLFSLGSVVYAMCTGCPPFGGDTTEAVIRRVCAAMPRPIRELNPKVPDGLVEIVEKLQAKNPADRFQSAADVAQVLGRHLTAWQPATRWAPDHGSPEPPGLAAARPARSGFLEERQAAAEALKKIPSREGRIGIRDEGRFFSPGAIAKATEEIDEIARRFAIDIRIETDGAAPARQAARLCTMTRLERAAFFRTWAEERAQAAGVHGIDMVLCQDLASLWVAVLGDARPIFDDRAINKLRDLVLDEFRVNRFDDGLLLAVTFIRGKVLASK